jgi:hypothetical protein
MAPVSLEARDGVVSPMVGDPRQVQTSNSVGDPGSAPALWLAAHLQSLYFDFIIDSLSYP